MHKQTNGHRESILGGRRKNRKLKKHNKNLQRHEAKIHKTHKHEKIDTHTEANRRKYKQKIKKVTHKQTVTQPKMLIET